MDLIGQLVGLLWWGGRDAPDWQVLIEIDGVPRALILPGRLGATWAGSSIGSEDFERAAAEIRRLIALAPMASRSAVTRPVRVAAR